MEKRSGDGVTPMNAVLCFSVVMIHLTAQPVAALTYGSFWHVLLFAVNKGLCFAVPAFLFLSGRKLYGKYGGAPMPIGRFYLGRAKKVLFPYAVCVLVYFAYFAPKGWASVSELPQYLLLGTLAAHFYYVIIAAQMYLVFPLLKKLFDRHPKTVTAAAFVCTLCFQQFSDFPYSDRFAGAYVFYFVLGMAAARFETDRRLRRACPVCAAGAVSVGAVHIALAYRSAPGTVYYHGANAVNIVYVTCVLGALYCVCNKMTGRSTRLTAAARAVGAVSYNVYLYHNLILFFLQYDVFPRFALTPRYEFLISCAAVLGAILLYIIVNDRIRSAWSARKKEALP